MTITRKEAIEKLVSKHFTLYSPLEMIDGAYKNKELSIYDCLFYLRIITSLGDVFDLDNVQGLRNIGLKSSELV